MKRLTLNQRKAGHLTISLLILIILGTSQSIRGEQIFSDSCDNSYVEDATSYSGSGGPTAFWTASLSPTGNTGEITEHDNKLYLKASGAVSDPTANMIGKHMPELDFFNHPVTFYLNGIDFTRESGAALAAQYLDVKLNSATNGAGNDEISVRLWGEGSIQVVVTQNGTSTTLYSSQISYVPESIVIYLDPTNYEVKFYHSSKIIATANGAHGLTASTWNSPGICPVIHGGRSGSTNKWVQFTIDEIKGFNGAIWRELVTELGKYSRSYMYMDWSNPALSGKNIADKNENDYQWQNVIGENVKVTISNQNDVVISNQFLRVDWNATAPHYYNTTLYSINNCKRVFIENVGIIQEDNGIGRDTIRIMNCEEVYIKNVFISGSAYANHIRIEGAKYILIDGVEIEGRNYGNTNGKKICANGIWVNNDIDGANDLEFLVIQNSYIHDFDDTSISTQNMDGIAVTNCADGIIFNNYIQNWKLVPADAAMDISHRRSDENYRSDYVFRLERNIIDKCTEVKTNGDSYPGNKIIWCNNLYFDVWPATYHYQYPVYHVNETLIWDDTHDQAFKLWNVNTDFSYILENCIYYSFSGNALTRFFYNTQPGDKRTTISSNSNLYYMSAPIYMYQDTQDSANNVSTFAAWQTFGQDTSSLFTNTESLFADAGNYDFRMASGTVAGGVANLDYLNQTNAGMRVHKDFLGYYRSTTTPCAGAYELSNRSSFGNMLTIPGVIEAEYFDNGGESSAYHDVSSGNAGGIFRLNENVDIYAADDSNVVTSEVGEYLKYTVDVKSVGNYRIDARVCGISTGNRTLMVYVDNVLVATYTFQNGAYHTATIASSISLSAGMHEVKVYFANSSIKLNYINFVAL